MKPNLLPHSTPTLLSGIKELLIILILVHICLYRRTPINVLIFNLAVADALFAAFISPKLIVGANLRHPEGWISSILCTFITGGGFGWVAAACSIYTLVAIAVERYYAVFDPRGKRWKLTNRKLKVCLPSKVSTRKIMITII